MYKIFYFFRNTRMLFMWVKNFHLRIQCRFVMFLGFKSDRVYPNWHIGYDNLLQRLNFLTLFSSNWRGHFAKRLEESINITCDYISSQGKRICIMTDNQTAIKTIRNAITQSVTAEWRMQKCRSATGGSSGTK